MKKALGEDANTARRL